MIIIDYLLSTLTFIVRYCPRWLVGILFVAGLAHVGSLIALIAGDVGPVVVLIAFIVAFAALLICLIVAGVRHWIGDGRDDEKRRLHEDYPEYWR